METVNYVELLKNDEAYTNVQKIESGSFGAVYKATRVDSEEIVAVKVLKYEKDAERLEKNKESMKREIELLSVLRHKNIIQILNSNINSCRLVLEFAQGGDLRDKILAMKGLDEMYARHVFKQVVEATFYLHDQQIQHNDIKPENIILMSNDALPVAKLIDFNLSCSFTRDSCAGAVAFSAPEKLRAKLAVKDGNRSRQERWMSRCTEKVDVWAIGVSLFESCTDKVMFSSRNPKEVLRMINCTKISKRFERLKIKFSRRLLNFLKICLKQNHRTRARVDELRCHNWLEMIPK